MEREEYYLAHSLGSRFQIRQWELDFEDRAGVDLINPFYDIERQDIKLLDAGLRKKYEFDPSSVVSCDVEQIRGAKSGLIAIIDENTEYGAPMEMVYAKTVFHKTVYTVVTNGKEKHPWLRQHSDRVFASFSDFENWWFKEHLCPNK